MTTAEMIKKIRLCLGMGQKDLAQALNVSFATVNRWENHHSEPGMLALTALHNFCERQGIDLNALRGNNIRIGEGKISLYHGSKSGITGAIAPISRDRCDFGKGFYMGTDRIQPLTLICNFPNAKLYFMEVELNGLQLLDVPIGLDWVLLIAYHRGRMEVAKGSGLYDKYAHMASNCDMIIGYIANDRMFVVLDRFFSGEITDTALIHSLSALKLGKQFVAITQKACDRITIVDETVLSSADRAELISNSEANRQEGIQMAEEICRKYRREGRFFDEIIGGKKLET
ncbi:MAG: DUF3990 domain-containing protein [Lachnospiraceae bacterium]|jgi:transcriptional regulator with XRE-family HTH domain|nr:DUF3990 domain-containing protein [Lachnospiraceae bacterium]